MTEVLATYTYTLINNDTEYSVTCSNRTACTKAIIPSEYNGLPVTKIAASAFTSDPSLQNLKEVVIPEGIEVIDEYAFLRCVKLEKINFPESLVSIRTTAFGYCSSLKEIVLPNNLTSIYARAFANCTELKSVIIGGVNTINSAVFSGCSKLTEIMTLQTTPPTLSNADAFSEINANAKIYVFQTCVNAYKSATNWNSLSSIIVADDLRIYFKLNANSAKNCFVKKTEFDGKFVLPPVSASSSGAAGQLAYDTDYFYVCVATDTWKRILLTVW